MSKETTPVDLTTANRFKEVFAALGVNANEVALKTGESNAKFYNLLNGRAQPSFATIQQLIEHYPRINANYLLSGKLPILHTSGAEIVGTGMTFVELPVINSETNMKETFPVLLRDKSKESYSDCVIVKATDNSMSPRFPLGTVLMARAVPTVEWDYVHSRTVAVSYRSVLVIRRIKENDLLTKGYITLYADDKDAGYVHVKREDLNSIWALVKVVSGDVD